MQLIERVNIDVAKWDELVLSTTNSSVFSLSWYMDATAENWCVLVDEDYSSGIALPYSVRAGLKILYTPIFVRYIEWFGNENAASKAREVIKEHFKIIEVSIKQPLLGDDSDEFIYQEISDHSQRKLGSQATRSLKKAIKESLSIEENTASDNILGIIKSELSGKYQGIDQDSINNLEVLFENARENEMIRVFHVINSEAAGGIVCVENKTHLLYLKGTVKDSVKKIGGMYLALDAAINYAQQKGLQFDFGGSRIEGVKKFNHNLGGLDTVYHAYVINNGPKWFSLIRRFRNKWIKK